VQPPVDFNRYYKAKGLTPALSGAAEPAPGAEPDRTQRCQWEYDSMNASHLIDPSVYVYAAQLVFERTWPGRALDMVSRLFPQIIS